MVTKAAGASLRKLGSTLVTPCSTRKRRKGSLLSSPLSSHVITHLREIPESDEDLDGDDLSDDNVSDTVSVESVEEDDEEVANNLLHAASAGCNLLIPELHLTSFIRKNFCCLKCKAPIAEKNLRTVNVGCACNLFWKCSDLKCDASDKIIAKQSTKEVSGLYKRYHPDVAVRLGDYDINRQIVLACQQSGGGARMASTFAGVMSLSNRSIWLNNFTHVEQMIGMTQIRIGKEIIHTNLQNEIAASPMDLTLNKAKVTLMIDGGWDQRASGKAYNSSSGRVVSVGPRTNKVCGLVYYSKR
jgi:hypothetical protein